MEDVYEFLENLRLHEHQWLGAGPNWCFRGQADSEWGLVPKAFRHLGTVAVSRSHKERARYVIDIEQAEKRSFAAFFGLADPLGLYVPGAERFHQAEYNDELQRLILQRQWPPSDLLEGLAVAQHHGVPTRLLDVTRNPMVAAFWAAYHVHKSHEPAPARLAVWGINLSFVRYAWAVYHSPELQKYEGVRIQEVKVPSARNPFLLAQSAFFLLDRHANGELEQQGYVSPIDRAILEHASAGSTWESLSRIHPERAFMCSEPVIQKVTLPSSEATLLLQTLCTAEDIHLAKLMPTFDNVTNTIQMMKDLDLM